MKVVFISNLLNHHQLPLSLEFGKISEFYFIATMPVPQEQLKLGYADMNEQYPFVVKAYGDIGEVERAKQLVLNADVVIAGSCTFPFEWLAPRLAADKLTFWFSERLLKHGYLQIFYPPTFLRVLSQCTKYRNNKNFYLLGAGGYVAKDYKIFGAFPQKKLRWAYLPKLIDQDVCKLLDAKAQNKKVELLWTARFLALKNPQYPIKLAHILKEKGLNFHINMVGCGQLLEDMKGLAKKLEVEDVVSFVGAVPFEEVRKFMDNANIFMFTSNRKEGWGAVLNESMNSGCATIASKYIGGAKTLIEDRKNGRLFKTEQEFYRIAEELVQDALQVGELGAQAYQTISEIWSAKVAAERLLTFSEAALAGKPCEYTSGPLSRE